MAPALQIAAAIRTWSTTAGGTMSGQARITGCALALLAAVALMGCGSRLTEEQARSLCTWVAMGGLSFAENRAEAEFGMSATAADDAVQSAIENHCPQYSGVTN